MAYVLLKSTECDKLIISNSMSVLRLIFLKYTGIKGIIMRQAIFKVVADAPDMVTPQLPPECICHVPSLCLPSLIG